MAYGHREKKPLPQLRLPTFELRNPMQSEGPKDSHPVRDDAPVAPRMPMPHAPTAPIAAQHHAPVAQPQQVQPQQVYYYQPAQQVHAAPAQRYQGPASQPPRRTVAFSRPAASAAVAIEQRSWFSPLHLGILATMIVVAWMVANGPGIGMKVENPLTLPAAPGAIDSDIANPKNGTLPLRRQPVGMPSAAASASIQFENTGTLPLRSTASIKFEGIPSPAAAASLDPNPVLPLKPSDGMSLPRTIGERDSYSVEKAYGNDPGAHAHDAEPARPAVTPMEAQAQAENQAGLDAATGQPTYPADMYQQ